jgi:hypothetical protein
MIGEAVKMGTTTSSVYLPRQLCGSLPSSICPLKKIDIFWKVLFLKA